ncbi:MAG TPA: thioredoxin family protein [Candidatus Acidoferrales bacterium]|nr:thioredoxin family protein [Candidatus Acidoferrales bacterium]
MRSLLIVITLASLASSAAPEKPPKADDILAAAKSQAAAQHKNIFLIFGASWCGDCLSLDAFLGAPEIQPLFADKYVISRISVAEEYGKNPGLNNPGSMNLLIKYGGVGPGGLIGLPYISILDEKGNPIIDSNRPVKGNAHGQCIGYPSQPEEIDWFLVMLKKNPLFTEENAKAVKIWLSSNAAN